MTKPNFESVALDLMLAHLSDYPDPLKNSVSRIKMALEQAHAAGRADERERCCAVATDRFVDSSGHEGDEWRFAAEEIIEAIRRGDEE